MQGLSGSFSNGPLLLPPDLMAKWASWSMEQFRAKGVPVPPGARLDLAQRLFDSIVQGDTIVKRDDDHLIRRIRSAYITVYESYLLVRASGGPRAVHSKSYLGKLKDAIGGKELEEDDSNHSARNIQFELYVASFFTMGGANVSIVEPDLQVKVGSEWIGIAAKRVQSPRALVKRAREGAKQIVKSRRKGIVAVNLDPISIDREFELDISQATSLLQEKIPEITRVDDELIKRELVLGRIAFVREISLTEVRGATSINLGLRFQTRLYRDDGYQSALSAIFKLAGDRFLKLTGATNSEV